MVALIEDWTGTVLNHEHSDSLQIVLLFLMVKSMVERLNSFLFWNYYFLNELILFHPLEWRSTSIGHTWTSATYSVPNYGDSLITSYFFVKPSLFDFKLQDFLFVRSQEKFRTLLRQTWPVQCGGYKLELVDHRMGDMQLWRQQQL